MPNLFWPIYMNLESEFETVTQHVHIDDKQLGVYSSNITNLILRAATEIESIAKELYIANGGEKTRANTKFDYDALKHLEQLWTLSKKVVLISSSNCFQSKKELIPFNKNKRKKSGTKYIPTFGWNVAYQHLKHDRAESLSWGSVEILFDIMAALYLLNIYYKNDEIEIGKGKSSKSFTVSLLSKFFSVKVMAQKSYHISKVIKPAPNIDEFTYLIRMNDASIDKMEVKTKKLNELMIVEALNSPNAAALQNATLSPEEKSKKINSLISEMYTNSDVVNKLMRESGLNKVSPSYIAELNKNQAESSE